MFKKTEYVTKRLGLKFDNWNDAAKTADQLLANGYQVFMIANPHKYHERKGGFYTEFELHFVQPDWDYEKFGVNDNYREYEIDGKHFTETREDINIEGWSGTAQVAEALLKNNYSLYIWTDGHIVGDQKELNYVIVMVHESENSVIERVEL